MATLPHESARTWVPGFPLDLIATTGMHRRGSRDPAFRIEPSGAIWRTSHTPDGAGTIRIAVDTAGAVEGRAWGPGADWLLDGLPRFLGVDDDPAQLITDDPIVLGLQRRSIGLRFGRTDRVWEALVPAILEQKVVGTEAWRAWRYLVRKYGEPAPGPVAASMRVPPPRQVWTRIPSWEWHRSGAEPVRMRTIRAASTIDVETRLDGITALRGIGTWTEAEVRMRAVGDPDAVPVGDYHIPSIVGQTLIDEPVDDPGMLELLEPFAGQRGRVVALGMRYGRRPQRTGHRMSVRAYRSM